MSDRFDLAVVGAGILGLAHALAARRRGLSVVVIDRETEAIGASVRNFGFVTVTGQQEGDCWRRALRSRDIWLEIAPKAGIEIEQHGLLVAAQRPEAMAVLAAFGATEMGADCRLLSPREVRDLGNGAFLADGRLEGGLWSPHERRLESRDAIPRLAAWLESEGVTFRRRTLAHGIEAGRVDTSTGPVAAEQIVVCPGDDLMTLFPATIERLGITRCRLHMMKVRPDAPCRLPGVVMSDLSLVRYLGYAELSEAAPLRARIEAEQPKHLANGIHLIVAQGRDGDLIVGDSHHYDWSPSPFAQAEVDDLILQELHAVLNVPQARVTERWTGTYASLPDRLMIREAPDPGIRLVIVTSGTGASTGFAIAEETVEDLLGV